MNSYVETCIETGKSVCVIMVNGFQMCGKIVNATPDYIIFKCANTEKLVFKHAISTIQPA